jgi:dihydrodipicolinate synthase/N-acetylneuraminate lyase
MLGIGGCGMMITASNVAPHLVAQFYETFAKRDIDGAIALNLKLYPLFRGVALESSPIPVKYMLKRYVYQPPTAVLYKGEARQAAFKDAAKSMILF